MSESHSNETLPSPSGAVVGTPRALLRLEGAAVMVGSASLYGAGGHNWWVFAAAFLVPDLSMLGYLANRRIGAALYNAGHSYLGPALVILLALVAQRTSFVAAALIWICHIGFDRMVGYGLKYRSDFSHTHLGVPFSWRAG